MHNMIKKTFLAAVMAAFCLCTTFPAYAEEPVGKDVTVVEETESEPAESKPEKDTGSGKAARASETRPSDDEYVDAGPGAKKKEKVPESNEISLGRYSITGYCGCDVCSGGHGLTYSGTVPTPNHTISADLDQFPLGTRLKIDGIVYTVEDKGSAVTGNILDIFYSSHDEALSKGTYTAEVFLIEDTAED